MVSAEIRGIECGGQTGNVVVADADDESSVEGATGFDGSIFPLTPLRFELVSSRQTPKCGAATVLSSEVPACVLDGCESQRLADGGLCNSMVPRKQLNRQSSGKEPPGPGLLAVTAWLSERHRPVDRQIGQLRCPLSAEEVRRKRRRSPGAAAAAAAAAVAAAAADNSKNSPRQTLAAIAAASVSWRLRGPDGVRSWASGSTSLGNTRRRASPGGASSPIGAGDCQIRRRGKDRHEMSSAPPARAGDGTSNNTLRSWMTSPPRSFTATMGDVFSSASQMSSQNNSHVKASSVVHASLQSPSCASIPRSRSATVLATSAIDSRAASKGSRDSHEPPQSLSIGRPRRHENFSPSRLA
eukprot:TRINITY_DN57263_c0_g1_i1.p1 TRINITY_DN57263_c0_g1~~TRINITY_DN57263_c0_g1_i1.p1  ORF type:complete len:355 (-),score=42.15 TRINITY_DN57263_c0_g1_i1:147-1211(-)